MFRHTEAKRVGRLAHFLSERASLPTRPEKSMIRLALIEDHQALRQGLELLLGREGCDIVGTAGTVREGRMLVRATEPDVVVIDVGLGDESGIDLTRELLAERPERRIVLYTGSSDLEHLLDGLDSGARGYALKEGAPQELMEAIEAVAGGAAYVDPRLRGALMSQNSTRRQPSLSVREREIIQLLAEGLTGEEVADRLVLSTETIKTHIRNAMTKLEARNRVHAIAIALRAGEISLGSARAGMVAR
jgi:DNA-binding NarL/FixJ family response regulator